VKKYFFTTIVIITVIVIVVIAVVRYWDTIRGILPVLKGPSEDIAELLNGSIEDSPLKLPPGFDISVFAEISGARVMVFDSEGDMWVSQTQNGTVTRVEVQNEEAISQEVAFRNLNKPHGLAFDPENSSVLYIAEEHRIVRVNLSGKEKVLEEVLPLPSGEGHSTRTIGFGPDPSNPSGQAKRLYISIGSSCNVCAEKDERRATILSVGRSASDVITFARGLRNAVFFTWHPFTKELWTTEMGRDWLGDDFPPDEVNIVERDGFYGWPTCYGKNVHDIDFDKNTYIRNPCQEPFEAPSHIDIPAHSAPLGLGFVEPSFGWPQEYWHDLIVAYHGSWNRTVPTGYKLVRIRLDEAGNYLGVEDFATGWARENDGVFEILGRPAGLLFKKDGTLYISDDSAGVIYKIKY